MAFDSLSDKLQDMFKDLRSKGRLTEDDVKTALKRSQDGTAGSGCKLPCGQAVRKVVEERAIGQDVMNGLNPGQMVIKIVNEEMVKLMGFRDNRDCVPAGEKEHRDYDGGLQGAGKTTTTAKLAGKLKTKGKKDTAGSL